MRTEKTITDLDTALVRISNLEAQNENLRVNNDFLRTALREAQAKLQAEKDWLASVCL